MTGPFSVVRGGGVVEGVRGLEQGEGALGLESAVEGPAVHKLVENQFPAVFRQRISVFPSQRRLRKQRIQHNAKRPLQHLRQQSKKQRRHQSQARVRIHLNQHRLQPPIQHYIIPQHLKSRMSSRRIQPKVGGFEGVLHKLADGREDVLVQPGGPVVQVEVLLEVCEGDLVSVLELTIILGSLLDCVVVKVPVLSKTTCLISLNVSKLFAFLNNTPLRAPRPKPTAIAAGVANPIAHGQEITNTAMARNMLSPKPILSPNALCANK